MTTSLVTGHNRAQARRRAAVGKDPDGGDNIVRGGPFAANEDPTLVSTQTLRLMFVGLDVAFAELGDFIRVNVGAAEERLDRGDELRDVLIDLALDGLLTGLEARA